jgi:DNA adenine methylase
MQRGNASYFYEMSDEDHRALAETLHAAAGMIVLSGYACELYDRELYPNWKRVEREHRADGAQPRIEALWINEAAEKRLSQGTLEFQKPESLAI